MDRSENRHPGQPEDPGAGGENVQLRSPEDVTFFSQHIAPYLPLVRNVARRRLNTNGKEHAVEPEDIVQTVAEAAFKWSRHLENMVVTGEAGRIRPWLLKVTFHECINELRKQNYPTVSMSQTEYGFDEGEFNHLDFFADEGLLPENYVEQRELSEAITGSIDAIAGDHPLIAEVYRAKLALADATDKEIGEAINVNENTVRTRFRRGRREIIPELRKRHITGP